MKSIRIRRKKGIAVGLIVVVVALVGLAGAIGATRSGLGESGLGGGGFGGTASAPQPAAVDSVANQDKAAPESADGSGGGSAVNGTLPPLQDPGQYLIRTGSLTLVVGRDHLPESVAKVNAITRAYDGYILSSTVGTMTGGGGTPIPLAVEGEAVDGVNSAEGTITQSTIEGGEPYAFITVRVPAARFDDALTRFQQLGDVRSLDTSTEDVTSQIVDLRARLRHYQAVEQRLLSFLEKAETVGAALAVQDRIDQTQLMVEEIKAQLKQLDETVTYSTLSVSMTETARPGVIDKSDSFWGAIKHSLTLVGSGFRWIAVAIGAILPFLVVLAIVGGVTFWLVRRNLRRRHESNGRGGPGVPPAADGSAATAGGKAA